MRLLKLCGFGFVSFPQCAPQFTGFKDVCLAKKSRFQGSFGTNDPCLFIQRNGNAVAFKIYILYIQSSSLV